MFSPCPPPLSHIGEFYTPKHAVQLRWKRLSSESSQTFRKIFWRVETSWATTKADKNRTEFFYIRCFWEEQNWSWKVETLLEINLNWKKNECEAVELEPCWDDIERNEEAKKFKNNKKYSRKNLKSSSHQCHYIAALNRIRDKKCLAVSNYHVDLRVLTEKILCFDVWHLTREDLKEEREK